MRHRRLLRGRRPAAFTAALLAALACAPVSAEPVRYRIDPDHAFAWFEVMHFGTATIRGRVGPISGDVVIDREAQRGEVGLRLPMATVNTGVPLLDARLRQADLLATAAAPEAFFVATRFRFEGGQPVELRGEFTLRNVSQALSLKALRFACRHDETGREVCGGDFEGHVHRSDFGMTLGLPFVSDDVRLLVQVEGVRL